MSRSGCTNAGKMIKEPRVAIISSNRRGINAREMRIAESHSGGGYDAFIVAWDRSDQMPDVETKQGILIYNFRLAIPRKFGPLGVAVGYSSWLPYLMRFMLTQAAEPGTLGGIH